MVPKRNRQLEIVPGINVVELSYSPEYKENPDKIMDCIIKHYPKLSIQDLEGDKALEGEELVKPTEAEIKAMNKVALKGIAELFDVDLDGSRGTDVIRTKVLAKLYPEE